MSKNFNFFNTELLKAQVYKASKRNKEMIRLDSMEHPFELSSQIIEEIKNSLQVIELNRYPESHPDELEQKIKTVFEINDDLSLLFGNGSDELIEMLILATDKTRPVFSLSPSFSMYQILSKTLSRQFIEVDLTDGFEIDLDETLKTIDEKNPSLIFISEPNNPTGKSFDSLAIEQICKKAKGLVVLDQAYFAFSRKLSNQQVNIFEFINRYSNVVVLRTLSKMGFAGIRFGFLIGAKQMVDSIRPLRLPYNINSFNQKLVDVALNHMDTIWQQIHQICHFRDEMFKTIKKLDGLKTYPSDTNFLLIQVDGFSSNNLHQKLLDENISTKDLKNSHPLIKDHIRVSMGLESENQIFIKALTKITTH